MWLTPCGQGYKPGHCQARSTRSLERRVLQSSKAARGCAPPSDPRFCHAGACPPLVPRLVAYKTAPPRGWRDGKWPSSCMSFMLPRAPARSFSATSLSAERSSFPCDPASAVASCSSWTPSASGILFGSVLDHPRDGGVAAVRVGAGTAQILRVFGEILAFNSHGGSGELSIS